MFLWTQIDDAVQDIHNAREKVERAQLAYRKGGGTKALNDANRELADCHARYREIAGGRPHDDRR
ncbi:hypothetical protein [Bradyrhizobium symbiodeficiens]|uniref:hypothetical protein n=1 Tax=Bradyrhizobium symbiodeficiens TaxID=1404367 RepID=UPI000BA1ACD8|nr:hypothetical protein [Bradyrhizobium symbiodeficiens]AWM07630.1 hypothetical protein CIT39_15030 [Bradyrhizobium symbiodeficiens]